MRLFGSREPPEALAFCEIGGGVGAGRHGTEVGEATAAGEDVFYETEQKRRASAPGLRRRGSPGQFR